MEDEHSHGNSAIEAGDWAAVGTLAAVSETQRRGRVGSKGASNSQSKEEVEAQEQAEIWMKIAEQKKAEGATDAGASDAAEWAIQRSLSQLKEADKKSEKKGGNKEEDEV